MSNRRSKPVDPIARLFREVVFPERYGTGLAPHALKLSCTNNRDSLLGAADDLHASTAWSLIEAQRGQWGRELPARRADLLPWLIEKDPGTTLLDLLAFCTGALLDGIAGDEKPHAINALASALNLDMTRYWTPTRLVFRSRRQGAHRGGRRQRRVAEDCRRPRRDEEGRRGSRR
jgi:hypothetical protein